MVDTTGVEPAFKAVNPAISPLPLATRPMPGLELVQLKVAPAGILLKFVPDTAPLLQTTMLAGTVTVGIGFTVTVIVAVPVHPRLVPVTV